jgi:hypothetical protein
MTRSELDIPLAPHCNNCPVIAIFVRLFFYLCRKADGAHDPIAELLIQHCFVRISIVLNNLIESIDQWLDRWHRARTTTIGESEKLLL